jgi:dephospho-CoA kinase
LQEGKNVLVDGSLRDAKWYLKYFENLRERFPTLKIAILHVMASRETVLERAKQRSKITGRIVPDAVILDSVEKISESLKILSPLTNFMATFCNENNNNDTNNQNKNFENKNTTVHEPNLLRSRMKNIYFKKNKKIECKSTTIWSLVYSENKYVYSKKLDSFFRDDDEIKNYKKITTTTTILDDWKDVFKNVWVMECALPSVSNNTRRKIDFVHNNGVDTNENKSSKFRLLAQFESCDSLSSTTKGSCLSTSIFNNSSHSSSTSALLIQNNNELNVQNNILSIEASLSSSIKTS